MTSLRKLWYIDFRVGGFEGGMKTGREFECEVSFEHVVHGLMLERRVSSQRSREGLVRGTFEIAEQRVVGQRPAQT
jgi:hypothetical protein